MRKSVGISWLLVGFVLAAIVAGGCSSSPYKTFSFEHRVKPNAQHPVEQVTHFSLEYPRDYRRISTYVKPDPVPPIIVRFARATGTFGCVRRTDTVFGINIGWGSRGMWNAMEAVDGAISGLGDPDLVHERSSVTVAGTAGEQVVYHDPRQPSAPEVRAVFFDYDGRIWEVYIYSETARAEAAKLDFAHIIQTFKILP